MDLETNLESAISAICVSCGLCCDGTLFRHATLKDREDNALATSLGMKVVEEQDKQYFELPCLHFKLSCTVYHQPRVKVCNNYYCKPLKELKRGALPLEDVRGIIERTVRLKQQFQQACQPYPEFSDQPISQIRPQLQSQSLNDAQQRTLRERYGILLVIGIKLFPLLNELKQHKKKTKDIL